VCQLLPAPSSDLAEAQLYCSERSRGISFAHDDLVAADAAYAAPRGELIRNLEDALARGEGV